jgi:hypothetical protein
MSWIFIEWIKLNGTLKSHFKWYIFNNNRPFTSFPKQKHSIYQQEFENYFKFRWNDPSMQQRFVYLEVAEVLSTATHAWIDLFHQFLTSKCVCFGKINILSLILRQVFSTSRRKPAAVLKFWYDKNPIHEFNCLITVANDKIFFFNNIYLKTDELNENPDSARRHGTARYGTKIEPKSMISCWRSECFYSWSNMSDLLLLKTRHFR